MPVTVGLLTWLKQSLGINFMEDPCAWKRSEMRARWAELPQRSQSSSAAIQAREREWSSAIATSDNGNFQGKRHDKLPPFAHWAQQSSSLVVKENRNFLSLRYGEGSGEGSCVRAQRRKCSWWRTELQRLKSKDDLCKFWLIRVNSFGQQKQRSWTWEMLLFRKGLKKDFNNKPSGSF